LIDAKLTSQLCTMVLGQMYQITIPRRTGPFSFVFILPESLRHLGLIRDYLYIPIQTCTPE